MKKRIALAAFVHETNTFTPAKSTVDDFTIVRGEEIFSNLDVFKPTKGMLREFQEYGYEVLPTIFVAGVPFGSVERRLFDRITAELIDLIASHGHVDAIALALHGALSVEGFDDGDGEILERLRSRFPADVVIACALDLHANVSEKMVKNANALVGYRTAPHVDMEQTGERVARLVRLGIEERAKMNVGFQKVPLLILGESAVTELEPMRSLVHEVEELEKSNAVLSASVFVGFPLVDVEKTGSSVVVVGKDNRGNASEVARRLGVRMWDNRHRFAYNTEAYPVEEAIDKGIDCRRFPVFISDMGDNPTAGAPEDNVNIVSQLFNNKRLETLRQKPLVAVVVDKAACAKCISNVGKEISVSLGGKIDTVYSQPIELSCVPQKAIQNYSNKNVSVESLDLVLVSTTKVDIIVSSKRVGVTDPKMIQDMDDKFQEREMFVVKSGYLFDEFRNVASHSILALTTGCADPVLERLTFKKVERPKFPLDRDFQFGATR